MLVDSCFCGGGALERIELPSGFNGSAVIALTVTGSAVTVSSNIGLGGCILFFDIVDSAVVSCKASSSESESSRKGPFLAALLPIVFTPASFVKPLPILRLLTGASSSLYRGAGRPAHVVSVSSALGESPFEDSSLGGVGLCVFLFVAPLNGLL